MNDFQKIISSLRSTQHPGENDPNKAVYFIGIAGIGMSAIARYFNSQGITVSGYDKTETALSIQLAAEGIAVHYEDNVALIDKTATLIVYTPAVPKDHKELNYYLD